MLFPNVLPVHPPYGQPQRPIVHDLPVLYLVVDQPTSIITRPMMNSAELLRRLAYALHLQQERGFSTATALATAWGPLAVTVVDATSSVGRTSVVLARTTTRRTSRRRRHNRSRTTSGVRDGLNRRLLLAARARITTPG